MPILPSSFVSPEVYTDELLAFIDTALVRQITGGIHVNDALIYGAWEALPPEWTTWWSSLSDRRLAQQDLIDSIDERSNVTGSPFVHVEDSRSSEPLKSRPKSLNCWLKDLSSLSLPRAQSFDHAVSLPQILTTAMKTKKIAEVSAAAGYIRHICETQGISQIIDIGSGQGYLSNALAYMFPSLRVLAIDGSESQIAGSKTFAATLKIPDARLKHLLHYVDGTASLATEMETWACGKRCILVGLHACGNLSEHMIRYFTTLPFVASLAAVGCCYNHIVPSSPSCPAGFPISARLKSRQLVLSATALMTGCQAPNNWETASLNQSESAFSKRHFYRALLEKMLFDKGITFDGNERPFWGIRKGDLASFETFARRAMNRLSVDHDTISISEMHAYEEKYHAYRDKVAILWTLSVLCCKIVESVIAMDRYWFLVEHKAQDVDIIPIFDYKISPRNMMVVANKKDI